MAKQMLENERVDEADWLIGEGCLLPNVKGVAIRSMKAPGTAYNDPRFVSAMVLTAGIFERLTVLRVKIRSPPAWPSTAPSWPKAHPLKTWHLMLWFPPA